MYCRLSEPLKENSWQQPSILNKLREWEYFYRQGTVSEQETVPVCAAALPTDITPHSYTTTTTSHTQPLCRAAGLVNTFVVDILLCKFLCLYYCNCQGSICLGSVNSK